jgi:cytochrome d ubiquinol oxidase subunit I
VIGDLHCLNTLKYQPAKVAAMEGNWKTQKGIPLILFAIPDKKTRSNKYSVEIPKLSSWILTHDLNGEVLGLNDFKEHPPVGPVFWSFRIMIAVGLLMLFVSWLGFYFYIRKKSLPNFYYKILTVMTFSGWFATLAGWYTTEVGRQPYLVSGVLKTADAIIPNIVLPSYTRVPSTHIAFSLTIYIVVYTLLLIAFISTLFYMARNSEDKKFDEKEFDPRTGQRRTIISTEKIIV